MLARAVADESRLELLQQFALLGGQVYRCFHDDAAIQVARGTAAHRFDTTIAQAELLAGLGLGRNAQFDFAIERGHAYGVAQRGLRDADRHVAVQVVAVAFEDLVRTHADLDIEIARRRTCRAGFALARQADAVTGVDARGNLDLEGLGTLDTALSVAVATGTGDGLAATTAMRAGLLHREDAALETHLSAAMAGFAVLQLAIGRTAALAGSAFVERGDLDFPVDPADRLLQRQLHHVADIGTAARPTGTRATAEDVAEDVAHVGVTRAGTTAATHAVFERGVAVLVVHAALGTIRQDFVGFLAFLERCFGSVVARVAIRVVLHRAATVGLFQVFIAGLAGHTQDFVVVALAHRCCHSPSLRNTDGQTLACPSYCCHLSSSPQDFLSSLTSVNSAST